MRATLIATVAERIGRFLEEAGRRRVWRSALTYGATMFVLLQLAEIVLPVFAAPPWALRLLVVSAFLGFPVVLTLAWVFDLTAAGLRRTEEPQRASKLLPRLALLATTLAMAGGAGWWTVRDTVAEAAPGALEGPGDSLVAASSQAEPPAVESLAVLPLDYFSEEGEGAHLAAGFHEELIAQLSRMAGARVVSRTSVVSFDRTGKAMPTIARELGVDGVVEGSVFRDGDRVRITIQLIHGPSDRHLWADSYDGTVEDAIAFQREAAGAIATAIAGHLSPASGEEASPARVALEGGSLAGLSFGSREENPREVPVLP